MLQIPKSTQLFRITNYWREIGYARVSKTEQHLALHLDALKKRGVIRVFTDKQNEQVQ